jgi:hypothetical protein
MQLERSLDMSNDPAFLFYPGDYLRDTQCLTEQAQVAYDRIMCEHMRNICISQTTLKFLTKRLDDLEREQIMEILDEVDGGFAIPWVRESIIKRREYSESRRNNRKGKENPTPKNSKKISLSYDAHMENENEDVNDNVNINKKVWFDVFWEKYNKKQDSKKCLDKWLKLSDNEINAALDKVEAYVKSTPDVQFRKNPLTWLNGKCWEDEIIIPTLNTKISNFEKAVKADLHSMIIYDNDNE